MAGSSRLIARAKRIRPSAGTGGPTPSNPAPRPERHFDLYGGVAEGFNSRAEELLMSGAAGTGKTLANLVRLYWVCRKYPGARCLILRKTRESLTESVLVTWERDVLGYDHPLLTQRPILRRVRQSYDFENRSVVVCGGIDKPGKVLSSEYDLIYVPEATDLTVEDWETVSGRLRAAAVPYQQIISDCNPTTPTHWLYKRCQAGLCRMVPTTHRDNPRYWDRAAGKWTALGEQYIARLGRMTGSRRKRFLEGIWAAAEGLVYDGYDPARHHLSEGWKPPADWVRLWSLDFGFTNPLALQFWAIDGDGRMYLYREFYRTHTLVEDAAKWAKGLIELGEEPRPSAVVCDHDPENAAAFERHSGCSTTPAEKFDKFAGIQQAQARFDAAGDGRPRIFVRPDLHPAGSRDPRLEEAGKPVGLVEELGGYIWDTTDPDRPKDEPVKKDDHSADAMVYAARYAESHFGPGSRDAYPSGPPPDPFARLAADTWR